MISNKWNCCLGCNFIRWILYYNTRRISHPTWGPAIPCNSVQISSSIMTWGTMRPTIRSIRWWSTTMRLRAHPGPRTWACRCAPISFERREAGSTYVQDQLATSPMRTWLRASATDGKAFRIDLLFARSSSFTNSSHLFSLDLSLVLLCFFLPLFFQVHAQEFCLNGITWIFNSELLLYIFQRPLALC